MVCASAVLVVVSVVVVVAGAFVVVVVGTVTGAGVVVGCLGRWEIGIPGCGTLGSILNWSKLV